MPVSDFVVGAVGSFLIAIGLFLALVLAHHWWQVRRARKRAAAVWKSALEALQFPTRDVSEAKNKSLEQTCRDLLRIAVDDDLVDEGCTEPENLTAGQLFRMANVLRDFVVSRMR